MSGFFTPSGIVYNTDNQALYVANRGANTISVINASTNDLLEIIPVGAPLLQELSIMLLMDIFMLQIAVQIQFR